MVARIPCPEDVPMYIPKLYGLPFHEPADLSFFSIRHHTLYCPPKTTTTPPHMILLPLRSQKSRTLTPSRHPPNRPTTMTPHCKNGCLIRSCSIVNDLIARSPTPKAFESLGTTQGVGSTTYAAKQDLPPAPRTLPLSSTCAPYS